MNKPNHLNNKTSFKGLLDYFKDKQHSIEEVAGLACKAGYISFNCARGLSIFNTLSNDEKTKFLAVILNSNEFNFMMKEDVKNNNKQCFTIDDYKFNFAI